MDYVYTVQDWVVIDGKVLYPETSTIVSSLELEAFRAAYPEYTVIDVEPYGHLYGGAVVLPKLTDELRGLVPAQPRAQLLTQAGDIKPALSSPTKEKWKDALISGAGFTVGLILVTVILIVVVGKRRAAMLKG